MEKHGVFFDEWIKSLREQYKHVIRNNDQVTLPSLTQVLHNIGFTDDELAQLRVEATMHVDDVGDDYVPDLDILNSSQATQPHPAECTCPQCIPINESLYDDEGQPLTDVDPEEDTHETGHIFSVAQVEPVADDTNSDLDDVDALTFEDSLAEETEEIIENEDLEEVDDESEDDPDAPQQLSMF